MRTIIDGMNAMPVPQDLLSCFVALNLEVQRSPSSRINSSAPLHLSGLNSGENVTKLLRAHHKHNLEAQSSWSENQNRPKVNPSFCHKTIIDPADSKRARGGGEEKNPFEAFFEHVDGV